MYNEWVMGFVVPENVVTHFHVRPGDRVGDFGAGSGHFTKALARTVGGDGKVFAVEIQKQLAEGIAEMARTAHLQNIEIVWGDLEAPGGIKLANDSLDAGVLSNTLFQIEDKDTACAEMARVLRKGGKLFIIDWTESFGGMGPAPEAVVPEAAVKECATKNGLQFERTFPAGEHHYGLAFRKA